MNREQPAYVFSLNLEDGKKFVGITTNPERAVSQHFSGNGTAWTQEHAPVSVNSVQACKNVDAAFAAENAIYRNMSNYHGADNVRDARRNGSS